MYMILFVLDDNSYLTKILDAWSDLGVSGVTIIETTGLHRLRRKHIPMRYFYGDTQTQEKGNTTLFAIVDGEKKIELCLDAVEQIVGDLDDPNTGVFCAWPLSLTKGIPVEG